MVGKKGKAQHKPGRFKATNNIINQKNNICYRVNRRSLKSREEVEAQAFRNLVRYRDTVIKAVQRVGGLDGVDAELAAHMHRLPIVEDYLTVMATGSAAERLELFREGVFNIWASL